MNYRVTHTTTYLYRHPVSMCHNEAHLTPRSNRQQTLRFGELLIDPAPDAFARHEDYFGNDVTFFTIQQPHAKLSVKAVSMVDVHPQTPEPGFDSPAWETLRDQTAAYADPDALDAFQYVFQSPFIKPNFELAAYAAPSFAPGRPMVEASRELMQRIFKEFTYNQTATTIATPIDEVLETRQGVCQDFAHLMIGCLRSLRLPARYVSGYLRTKPVPEKPRLVGADASHAWASVYCGDAGWIDFDPTNNVIPGLDHITVAWGRDYDDVSPLKGLILGEGDHAMQVGVEVEPL